MKHIQALLQKLEAPLQSALSSAPSLSAHLVPGPVEAIYLWTLNHRLNRNVLWVADGPRHMEERHQDLRTLAPLQRAADERLLFLPPAEFHTESEHLHGDPNLTGMRIDALLRMRSHSETPKQSPFVCVTTIQALLQAIPAPDELHDRTFTLALMDSCELDDLSTSLLALGYDPVPEVQEKAQFAIKGGIVDAWPVSDEWPLRIELFGSDVESIRSFDPVTQRSVERLGQARFVPVRDPSQSDTGAQAAPKSSLLDYLPANTVIVWSVWDSLL